MIRRPNTLLPATLCALAVAACGQSGSEDKTAAAALGGDPVKAAAEMAFQFQPGHYRTTIEIQKIEIPGMPAGFANQMKASMSRELSREHCISPEQAAKGVEAMKQHMGQGKCEFESFNARGGTVDSVFTCQTGANMTLRSTTQGTYTSTGSRVATRAEMKGPMGKTVEIEQTITTARIGNCS